MPYAHLLSPATIGRMTLRNRICMSAMGSDLSGENGIAGESITAYYEARARGGVGLIVTEAVPIAFPSGFSRPHAMAIATAEQRGAVAELVKRVQSHGARIALQLNHHGPLAKRDMIEGRPLLVPSMPRPSSSDLPAIMLPREREFLQAQSQYMPPLRYHVLSEADIGALVRSYAEAAARVRETGADGIELHAAHGFLLSSFLSPRTNLRRDRYGGSRENRARFLLEVLDAIRKTAGSDFPVWCKIDAVEHLTSDGITLEDAKMTAQLAVESGAAAIMVSTSADPASAIALTTSHIPHTAEAMVDYAWEIKKAVSVPVIATGRMEPGSADKHIERGRFDLAAFGRKMLADPEFALKLGKGREPDIRPCIYCYACISQLSFDKPVKCAVNPETGHELGRAVRSTGKVLVVAVIGGGPAGMEAARRLTLSGHVVHLIEAEMQLGGTLRFASLAYLPNQKLLDWLRRQIFQLGVKTHLGTPADLGLVRALKPDIVVVATGAERQKPPIPGANLPHVLGGDDLRAMLLGADTPYGSAFTRFVFRLGATLGVTSNPRLLRAVSRFWMPLGRHVVVIGGDIVGLELAEFLRERGRVVTVVSEVEAMGEGLHLIRRAHMFHELDTRGVTRETGVRDIEITRTAVTFSRIGGNTVSIRADSVLIAKGATGNSRLADTLRAAGFTVHELGDAKGIGYIEGALEGAAELARRLSV